MIEMCDLLLTHALNAEALATDPVVQGAAQRWIEVLGEAASHVSGELKQTHPEVSWREIVGIRVILAHAYFHIDQDIVGNLIARDVPTLRAQLNAILEGLDQEPS